MIINPSRNNQHIIGYAEAEINAMRCHNYLVINSLVFYLNLLRLSPGEFGGRH